MTTATIHLSREIADELRATALREMSMAGDDLAHLDHSDDAATSAATDRMRRALGAYDAMQSGEPSPADLSYLAGVAIAWEADDDDVRLPSDPDELAAMRARLDRAEELIALRDGTGEGRA